MVPLWLGSPFTPASPLPASWGYGDQGLALPREQRASFLHENSVRQLLLSCARPDPEREWRWAPTSRVGRGGTTGRVQQALPDPGR